MSWQERDYAKGPTPASGGAFQLRRGTGIWGGSIVNRLLAANIVMFILCYMTPIGPTIRGVDPKLAQVRMANGSVGVVVLEEGKTGLCEMITTKVLHGQVWRVVTSQYLHANQMHIIFNMIGLYFLGRALERVWGNKKFFVIYTIAGVCGNLLLMIGGLTNWISPDAPAVGASGCILGLLGAAAVMFPQAEVLVYFLFPVKIRTVAIIVAAGYLLNIYSRGSNYGGDLCHMAGLAFGAWWAWKGERWWAMRRFTAGPQQSAQPKTRIWSGVGHGSWRRKVERHIADEETVDRILAKVREGGIGTLSEQEKKILLDTTERLRRQESSAGRTDRL